MPKDSGLPLQKWGRIHNEKKNKSTQSYIVNIEVAGVMASRFSFYELGIVNPFFIL